MAKNPESQSSGKKVRTRLPTWSHALAFLAGCAVTFAICWWGWISPLRHDLDWAANRGIWFEAHYNLCIQGIDPKPQK